MNKITNSVFRGHGVATTIENPSLRIVVLMTNLSIDAPEKFDNEYVFHHRDIGTMENMEMLFQHLDACP